MPVTFEVSDRPAAAPIGYPGLAPRAAFEIAASTDDSIVYRKVLPRKDAEMEAELEAMGE